MAVDTQYIIGGLTLVVSILVAYVTSRGDRNVKLAERTVPPYTAIVERVGTLETRVDTLEEEQYADRAYISQAAPWIATHIEFAKYQWPTPPKWYKGGASSIVTTKEEEDNGTEEEDRGRG